MRYADRIANISTTTCLDFTENQFAHLTVAFQRLFIVKDAQNRIIKTPHKRSARQCLKKTPRVHYGVSDEQRYISGTRHYRFTTTKMPVSFDSTFYINPALCYDMQSQINKQQHIYFISDQVCLSFSRSLDCCMFEK
jgi:hypothetical protein